MFHILTAIVILLFLWRFQMNYTNRKKCITNGPQTTDHKPTDGQTDRPSYRDAWTYLKMFKFTYANQLDRPSISSTIAYLYTF